MRGTTKMKTTTVKILRFGHCRYLEVSTMAKA
jgi:hypothetical protein